MAQFVRNLAEKAPALVNAAVTYSKPRLATFWYYAKVELVPPTPAEIPTAIQSLKKIINSAKTGSFKQLTVKPYGLWSARLLCSWDSPGKNTGVGCHAFPRDLPDPGTEPKFLISLALAESEHLQTVPTKSTSLREAETKITKKLFLPLRNPHFSCGYRAVKWTRSLPSQSACPCGGD